ncbi:hypothetical protein LJC18_04650 [Lachnospiraceae bacterium OttesenSCG-928-E19]|nr:hypothetical protein [Lachnospiraceae bacterium OttesenSCG-928-E19]
MANNNPDTSGLKPFNTMGRNESAVIQRAGGLATAEKRRRLRTIKEIIQSIRETADVDPVESAVIGVFKQLNNPKISIRDKIKVIVIIHGIIGEKPTDWTSEQVAERNKPIDPKQVIELRNEFYKLAREEKAKDRSKRLIS